MRKKDRWWNPAAAGDRTTGDIPPPTTIRNREEDHGQKGAGATEEVGEDCCHRGSRERNVLGRFLITKRIRAHTSTRGGICEISTTRPNRDEKISPARDARSYISYQNVADAIRIKARFMNCFKFSSKEVSKGRNKTFKPMTNRLSHEKAYKSSSPNFREALDGNFYKSRLFSAVPANDLKNRVSKLAEHKHTRGKRRKSRSA